MADSSQILPRSVLLEVLTATASKVLLNYLSHNNLSYPIISKQLFSIFALKEAQLDEPISRYISVIRDETNIDTQIKLLQELNALLPIEKQLLIPSLITNDYVSKAVNNIEEIWFERKHEQRRFY